jgi:hypothetical protein
VQSLTFGRGAAQALRGLGWSVIFGVGAALLVAWWLRLYRAGLCASFWICRNAILRTTTGATCPSSPSDTTRLAVFPPVPALGENDGANLLCISGEKLEGLTSAHPRLPDSRDAPLGTKSPALASAPWSALMVV